MLLEERHAPRIETIERLFALSDFILGARDGVDIAAIKARYPEWYGETQGNERRLYKELSLLLYLRPVTRVSGRYIRADLAASCAA